MKKLLAAFGICFLLLLTSSPAYAELIYAYTWSEYDDWSGKMKPVYDVYVDTENITLTYGSEMEHLCVILLNDYKPYNNPFGIKEDKQLMYFQRSDTLWNGRWRVLGEYGPESSINPEVIWDIIVSHDLIAVAQEKAVREYREWEEQEKNRKEQERKRAEMRAKEKERQSQKYKWKQLIESGSNLLSNKKYKEAETAFKNAIDIAMQSKLSADALEESYIGLAVTYESQKDFVSMYNLFTSSSAPKKFRQAVTYFLRGESICARAAGAIVDHENKDKIQMFIRVAKADFQQALNMNPDDNLRRDAKKGLEFLETLSY